MAASAPTSPPYRSSPAASSPAGTTTPEEKAAGSSDDSGLDIAPYIDILDRSIEDRQLDQTERDELVATAATLGIDAESLEQVHRQYVDSLVEVAWRDGGLSERERKDLFVVAMRSASLGRDYEGEPVTRELAIRLASEANMTVIPRVTRKLDLLVVADPNSVSEKARKAYEYGIRIVAETAFWSMIGVEVS